MTVGILGLGLIGGSLAKAYKRNPDITVLGYDIDESMTNFAAIAGAIDGTIDVTAKQLPPMDLLLVALYPAAVEEYVKNLAPKLDKNTLVIDCAGVKREVCEACFPVAQEYGFDFIGGHPMAGTQFSGFANSQADLFDGAPMVLVPATFSDIRLLDKAKRLLSPAGFGTYSFITAQEHDMRIAFTSQLAHVVSNAYVKSPTAQNHKGFSAGSYRDLTRVAWLNPDMWAELFLDNRGPLLYELETLILHLQEYLNAIHKGDYVGLRNLLEEGKNRKEAVDG